MPQQGRDSVSQKQTLTRLNLLATIQVVVGDQSVLQPCSVVLPGTHLPPNSVVPALSTKRAASDIIAESEIREMWPKCNVKLLPPSVYATLQVQGNFFPDLKFKHSTRPTVLAGCILTDG